METQQGQVTQGQAPGGAPVQAPSAPAAAAVEGTGVVERLGYQRTLEDILSAHHAKNRRCGLCHGIGHSYGQCPTKQEMM